MLTIKEMETLLEKALPRKRFEHSVAVYETALELAKIHNANMEKVAVASLLHDCGREIPTRNNLMQAAALNIEIDAVEQNQPILLHAKIGVCLAQNKYGVTDKETLDAILYHTTGAPGMSKTAMIVYLADLLEPKRGFFGIEEMRQLVKVDLEKTMMKAYALTIKYLLEHDLLIHPNCIYGRNELAIKFKKKNPT
ncbi:MAG: HD domain-containing protein [Negativicutes bacterium]|nr:HD domain-containing protein [Negativicutes bacterium]